MSKFNFAKRFVLTLLTVLCFETVLSCSMYKVTANGKTMVGSNEDSWGRDARIWFEPRANGKFGVVCVGYARKQPHPDGAMNEFGLAFDAFTMRRKSSIPKKDPAKEDFAYADIRTIMQQCKTVNDVYSFLKKLNLHILNGSPIFNGGMLLFVDKTGNYLVVEADKLTLGNDTKFALANFSIADTKDLRTIKMPRYRKGIAFLNNKKLSTSLSFCTALSDTMSENRPKIGDGTLYTNIYDLEKGLVHLYFYHDFSKRVTLNLEEELAKGNHSYDFVELFPRNKSYQTFLEYKTPQSNWTIFFFIVACGILFFFSFVFFLISFFKSPTTNYNYLKLGMALLSVTLCVYTYVLLRNEGVFYFPSPYSDGISWIVSLTSYLPFVLLLVIFPLLVMMVSIFRQKKWSGFMKYLLATNNMAYLMLIGLFVYWGLFDIFN